MVNNMSSLNDFDKDYQKKVEELNSQIQKLNDTRNRELENELIKDIFDLINNKLKNNMLNSKNKKQFYDIVNNIEMFNFDDLVKIYNEIFGK